MFDCNHESVLDRKWRYKYGRDRKGDRRTLLNQHLPQFDQVLIYAQGDMKRRMPPHYFLRILATEKHIMVELLAPYVKELIQELRSVFFFGEGVTEIAAEMRDETYFVEWMLVR